MLVIWWSMAAGCVVEPTSTGSSGFPSEPPTTWYLDADGDGFGVPWDTREAVWRPQGYASAAGDCDDSDPSAYPNAFEVIADGIDQDCDGQDATCENRPQFPGTLALRGDDALDTLRHACNEYSTVAGVELFGTSWTDLEPLRCLCRIGNVLLVDNPELADVSLLVEPWVLSGEELVLSVFEAPITDLRATVDGPLALLTLTEVDALTEVELIGLTEVTQVVVQAAPALTSLRGFERVEHVSALAWYDVPALAELPAFDQLRSVTNLVLSGTSALKVVDGMPLVESIDTLDLKRLDGELAIDLPSLRSLGRFRLENTTLTDYASVGGLPLSELQIIGLTPPSLPGLSVTELDALSIYATSLESLEGLESLTTIHGRLSVTSGSPLRTLKGLEGLRSVASIVVNGNDELNDVTALHGTAADEVHVTGKSLTTEQIQALHEAIEANSTP